MISQIITETLNVTWVLFMFSVSWIFMVGAMRKSVTTIAHHSIHMTFSKNRLINIAIAEIATTITLSASFLIYDEGHRKQHHVAPIFTTENDPDAAFLVELGFLPGMSKRALWKHLYLTMASPYFHIRYTWNRIKQNFYEASPYRIVMSIIWWSFVFYLMIDNALAVALLYLFPLTVLFQISALLQFISEHEWLAEKNMNEPAVLAHSHHSWGRFIGPEIPKHHNQIVNWLMWMFFYLKVLFVYIPVRVAILPGDLPQHDQHHRKPMGDWCNAAYERRDAALRDDNKVPYKHYWSLKTAIDHVFNSLSEIDVRHMGIGDI